MSFVTVIGGANADIGGWPEGPARTGESNPGTVRLSLGGVGRNIAHGLAALGVETRLIAPYGGDVYARLIQDSCRSLGIDDSASPVFPDCRTAAYLFVTDGQGELALAVSDTDICRRMTPAVLSPHLSTINAGAALVVDANLPRESLGYLARHCTVPIFADPVSLSKCRRLGPILARIHTLKPNRTEAQALSGVCTEGPGGPAAAARALLERGVGRVLLSLGPEGLLAAEAGQILRLPPLPARVVNITGAGDAMMAAAVRAFLLRRSLEDTAREALAAASLSLESAAAVPSDLSAAALAEKLSGSAPSPQRPS